MRNQKGFTLVELIIVIAVIGVLAAILIPVFANVIEKSNRASALSDATNAVKQYTAEITTGDGMEMPTIFAMVHKGSKVYTAVYVPGDEEGTRLLEGAEKKYSEGHGIAVCGIAIISELEDSGVIAADPNGYADPNTVLAGLGYDTAAGIYLEKDYVVVDGEDINEATTTDSMDGVPLPPPVEPVAVRPVFAYDEVNDTEVFTFTITRANITNNMAVPGETDGAVGIALDFGPIIEEAANNMGTMNWNGYDVKIINNSGTNLNLSKVVINVPSGATGFTCKFATADVDLHAFAANPASGTALAAGENVITIDDYGITSTGMFLLGYTGGSTPSVDEINALDEATVKAYYVA